MPVVKAYANEHSGGAEEQGDGGGGGGGEPPAGNRIIRYVMRETEENVSPFPHDGFPFSFNYLISMVDIMLITMFLPIPTSLAATTLFSHSI